jgi:NitT/TauT family transport system substrate-binding protein
VIAATPALAQDTEIQFALDWRFEGPSAPYFLAIDNGYFAEQGLSVEVTAGQGSLDAIPKVASGAFPMGFADINSLMRFLDQNPGAPVTAVMMVYDSPPFAIVGRVSQGISGIEDLEGSVLGAPPPDGAWAQFPILAAVNDIDVSTITVEEVGFPTREPMLAEGNVDAVTGFNFSSYLSLARLGIPEDDITTIMFADHGVALYGNAVIVNTDFAAENPDAVTGALTAIAQGWADAIADPAAGAAAVHGAQPCRRPGARDPPPATGDRRQRPDRLRDRERHGQYRPRAHGHGAGTDDADLRVPERAGHVALLHRRVPAGCRGADGRAE